MHVDRALPTAVVTILLMVQGKQSVQIVCVCVCVLIGTVTFEMSHEWPLL